MPSVMRGIQGVSEALHEGHGTAPDPPVSTSKARTAAKSAEDDLHEYAQHLREQLRLRRIARS